jgi:hypothetical protein
MNINFETFNCFKCHEASGFGNPVDKCFYKQEPEERDYFCEKCGERNRIALYAAEWKRLELRS